MTLLRTTFGKAPVVATGAALARSDACYRLALLASAFLPPRLSYDVARQIGRLRYRGIWDLDEGRRQSISRGLRVDREQADTLLDEFFQYWASEDLDSILYRILPAQRLATLIEVRDLENLDAALANGRGAILYSGHVHGQYTLLAALGLRGYRPTMVRLGIEAAFSPLRRWLFLSRCAVLSQKYDCRFIVMFYQRPAHWRSESKQLTSFGARAADARNRITPRSRDLIVQALGRNEVVVVLIDMPFTRHKVAVDFFGHPFEFPIGPVEIARETGAPLLDFYIHRGESWIPQIAEIGPPVAAADNAAATLQSCAARLEARIRQHPAGWAGWHVIAESSRGG